MPQKFNLKERDFESHGYTEGCPGCISLLKRGARLAHSKGCRVRMEEVMKGDERLARANKRTNEHLAMLVKANVEKAEAEKKAKLDKDMEVDTGVGERGMGHRLQQRWLQALAPSGTSTQMMGTP